MTYEQYQIERNSALMLIATTRGKLRAKPGDGYLTQVLALYEARLAAVENARVNAAIAAEMRAKGLL
jgi:hypothetical protein